MSSEGLARWHECISKKDFSTVMDFLDDDIVMHSPVVWTPLRGKSTVAKYLIAAGGIIANDSFRYVREISDQHQCVLEFVTEIDGVTVEGVDLLTFTETGKLKALKVMVRPLQGMTIVHQKMAEFLARSKAP